MNKYLVIAKDKGWGLINKTTDKAMGGYFTGKDELSVMIQVKDFFAMSLGTLREAIRIVRIEKCN